MKTTISKETINGKEIPVAVHVPVNNGEAANNVEIKDMSPKIGDMAMSMDDFNRMMALYNQRVNANNVTLSAEISAKEIIKGKEKIDKASGLPVLDGEGFPLFYPNRYNVTLTFKGGTLVQSVSETTYNELNIASTYMFKGSLGFVKQFGQDVLSPVWSSWELVA